MSWTRFLALPRRPAHRIEIVVDRLVLDEEKHRRLVDSLELALRAGKGTVGIATPEGVEKFYSESARCASCGYTGPELSPSLFSFQHPSGMCPLCRGLGYTDADENQAAPGADVSAAAEPEGPELPEFSSERSPCSACNGTRLNEAARSVRLGGLSIDRVFRMNPPAVAQWLEGLDFDQSRLDILKRPQKEILNRLNNLIELGLPYLTLDRASNTLSGGEAQRVRLAHQISSTLSGVLYVLDEPSVGLHPRDHGRLLDILIRLRDAGNSLVVVEHDKETILRADHVIDMGPGAGTQGGEVVFSGPPEKIGKCPASLTGLYISGKKQIPVPKQRKKGGEFFRITGAAGHNLKRYFSRILLRMHDVRNGRFRFGQEHPGPGYALPRAGPENL